MAKPRHREKRDSVEVCIAADFLPVERVVGMLYHEALRGSSVFSFEYNGEWLASRHRFALDPQLDLYRGETYADTPAGNFRIFLDSAPDRWGRALMDRREALTAHEERRPVRTLIEWDYLLGVSDLSRPGALRFRREQGSPYLDNQDLAAPPVTSLPELQAISLSLEDPNAEDMPQYRKWLATLIAPGSSLGGTRPKANFTDADDSLWIAKFPSREDRRNVGAWEKVVHDMARECRISVPASRVIRLGSAYHTFCCRRFDRSGRGRRFFVSAMTMLERNDGDAGSYLELAQFLNDHGARNSIEDNLEQLWRRVAFNVLVSNTDDHLRNHGFIRETSGWHLAPAYDMNPNLAKREHTLTLDGRDATPHVDLVLDTAELYRLDRPRAARILTRILAVIRTWRDRARALGLGRGEIDSMTPAFALADTRH